MSEGWCPALEDGPETIHDRLLTALQRDIEKGRLKAGAKLPPHRELARRLGVAIGTVTKVYAAGERRGLLVARVGSGTFVANVTVEMSQNVAISGAEESIDLTLNLPPLTLLAGRLGETLARLRRQRGLDEYLEFAPHAGFDAHRRTAADWLARTARYGDIDWRRLVLCTGAQQAMFLTLGLLCRPGDAVLTEAATFHGMKSLAEHGGYRLIGLPMDGEGLRPEALDRAAAAGAARVLYIQPTLHNPTGRTMTAARREDIVRVARRHDLWILEGDVYAPFAWLGASTVPAASIAPLASLAPERTFYASSVTKALAPGLRTGFLVVPDADYLGLALKAMRATCYSASAFGPLIASQWIEDGTADSVVAAAVREAEIRTALAQSILGAAIERPCHSASFHVWMPLPEIEAERVAGRALRAGVILTPPGASLVEPNLMSGLRICLGTSPNIAVVTRALNIVAASLSPEADERSHSVV